MARPKKSEWVPTAGDFVRIKATGIRKAFRGTISGPAREGYMYVRNDYNGGLYTVPVNEIVLVKSKRAQ